MPKLHEFRFKVIGDFQFPIDMLRYDNCRPFSEIDSNLINGTMLHAGLSRPTEIELMTMSERKMWLPTFGRWESFGWKIKHDYMMRDGVPQ